MKDAFIRQHSANNAEEAEPNPYSPLDLTTLEARLAIVTTKVDRLMISLAASPHRVEYVSTVRLEPFDGAIGETAHELIEVLMQVSHRVRRLDILPQPMDPARTVVGYDRTGCTLFFRFMAATTGPVLSFPRIKHLKYAYPPQAAIPVGDWLMRMSSLEEIDFCSSIGSYRISRPFVGARVDLPNLRRISVDHQDDRLYAPNDGVLHSLLEIAPELEVLRVRGEWDPQRRDYALQSMETLDKLKTIILVDFEAAEADPSDDDRMGITMSRLGMGEGDLVVEELAAKFDELDERRDGHLHVSVAFVLACRGANGAGLETSTSPGASAYDTLLVTATLAVRVRRSRLGAHPCSNIAYPQKVPPSTTSYPSPRIYPLPVPRDALPLHLQFTPGRADILCRLL
jgi:hypothetical protein